MKKLMLLPFLVYDYSGTAGALANSSGVYYSVPKNGQLRCIDSCRAGTFRAVSPEIMRRDILACGELVQGIYTL